MTTPKPPALTKPMRRSLMKLYVARATTPALLRRNLYDLFKAYDRVRAADLLLDRLLRPGSAAFAELDVAGEVLLLAQRLGRLDEAQTEFERRVRTGKIAEPHWRVDFRVGKLRSLGREACRLIMDLKFAGIRDDAADPFASARQLASRLVFADGVLDRLFAASRFQHLGRERWEEEVRIAFASDHLTNDLQARASEKIGVNQLFDPEAAKAVLLPLADEPSIFLMFHGGYLNMTKQVFADTFPNGLRVQNSPVRGAQQLTVRDDRNTALFSALGRLRDGGSLQIAPDAPIGSLKGTLTILGGQLQVAEGSAFLAYESGCRIAWMNVERDEDDRFLPRIAVGPRAEPGESFRSYKTRFHAFLGAEFDRFFTGHPRNLVFRLQWERYILGLPG